MKIEYAKERAEEIHTVADMFEQRIDKDSFFIQQVGGYINRLGAYNVLKMLEMPDKLWAINDVDGLREVNFFKGKDESKCLEKLTETGSELMDLCDLTRQFPRGVCICDDDLPAYLRELANAFSAYYIKHEITAEVLGWGPVRNIDQPH